jgi:hypothetical protein
MEKYKCVLCGTPMKKIREKIIGNLKYEIYRCEKCNRVVAKSVD